MLEINYCLISNLTVRILTHDRYPWHLLKNGEKKFTKKDVNVYW